ncbi:DUF1700 domain-containing protein [Gimesia fumaroli]|uniref:Uncharacterized protein n=1 Tax=Gimesia fumaroli TaxID=2527976 RepID=A0A518IHA9_9PLAN|nr:hypothetical protein [Gimesia fumaroli]QDV52482.1 hypothetical protein Enr17x_45450 [Gimesia fumaroli]
MAWPEISIEDFPPKRDDEPSSLRQDIIDELTDHFACALNRELLKNSDEQTAKQRVLNQFGDPIKIARQLWLDAMQEKMMSQRILTGISTVMAVCCIAVVGIAWTMMQESRAFNLQMLEQFKQAQERSSVEASGDLHEIQFQLVQDGSKDEPAVGFEGTLAKYESNNVIFTVDAVSDEMGLLDFGKLPWGEYVLNLKAPWGGTHQPEQITTIPGRKYEQTIVCPAGAPKKVEVQFQVNWQNIPEEDYYLLCDFRSLINGLEKKKDYVSFSLQEIQGRSWVYRRDLGQESVKCVYLFDVKKNRAAPCTLSADGSIEKIELEKLVWSPTVEFLQGQYQAPTIYLIQKNDLSKVTEINSMESIKTIHFEQSGYDFGYYGIPARGLIVSPFKRLEIDPSMVVDKTPSELKEIRGLLTNPVTKTYSATNDQPNVWEINIPDLFPITAESGSLSSVQ